MKVLFYGQRRPPVALLLALFGGCVAAQPKAPTVEEARALAASRPRYLRSLPAAAIPEGLPDLTAATCGKCHQEIYEEWRISTHARAWKDDLQFLAELDKSKKQGVDWLCMNCHTPLENQLPQLVARLEGGQLSRPVFVDNPGFEAALQEEAITCATCHVQDGFVLGPYGDTVAPHPVRQSDLLKQAELCTQCHQAQARFDELGLICVFDTGSEFKKSPQAAAGKVCQSCHMPEVERGLVADGKKRITRRHWFGGSLIPKRPEFAAELEPLASHYPPGLAVTPGPLPKRIEAGAKLEWVVAFENKEAGHWLPTGDPERYLLVELEARDADGQLLGRQEERIGIEYQWYPEVKKLKETRLAPGEKRSLSLSVVAPPRGSVQLLVKASRWRISPKNLAYHQLEGRYVPSQVFFEKQETVPVGR